MGSTPLPKHFRTLVKRVRVQRLASFQMCVPPWHVRFVREWSALRSTLVASMLVAGAVLWGVLIFCTFWPAFRTWATPIVRVAFWPMVFCLLAPLVVHLYAGIRYVLWKRGGVSYPTPAERAVLRRAALDPVAIRVEALIRLKAFLEAGAPSSPEQEGYRANAGLTGVRVDLVHHTDALLKALASPGDCVQLEDAFLVPGSGWPLDPLNRSLISLEVRYEQIVSAFDKTTSSR